MSRAKLGPGDKQNEWHSFACVTHALESTICQSHRGRTNHLDPFDRYYTGTAVVHSQDTSKNQKPQKCSDSHIAAIKPRFVRNVHFGLWPISIPRLMPASPPPAYFCLLYSKVLWRLGNNSNSAWNIVNTKKLEYSQQWQHNTHREWSSCLPSETNILVE